MATDRTGEATGNPKVKNLTVRATYETWAGLRKKALDARRDFHDYLKAWLAALGEVAGRGPGPG